MAQKAIPGEETAHDAFEGLLDTVWRQEHLWRLTDRLDAQLDLDESRARGQATAPQARKASPAKPRARLQPAPHRVRSPRARKADGKDAPVPNRLTPEIFALLFLAVGLSTVGLVVAGLVKLVRLLI